MQRKVDAKTHINVLDPLLAQLRRRTNVVILKRITIVLDEESEKGFGLVCEPLLYSTSLTDRLSDDAERAAV